MKVINVISDTNIGGGGICLLNYIQNYDRSKIELIVYLPFNSLLKEKLLELKCKVREIKGLEDTSFNFSNIKEFIKYFKIDKPNIVHTHASFSARVGAKIYGKCKIVYTRHSVFDQKKSNTTFPKKQFLGFANNFFSDKIIAVSPAAKENVVDTGGNPNKIEVIFNGVNQLKFLPENEKEDFRKSLGIEKDDFVISIVARLEEVKGHEYLLKCGKSFIELGYSNIKILIVGTGSLEKSLKDKVEIEKIHNVKVLGFRRDVEKILNITDLQVNCSYGTEATSLALLEGLSIGVPAVVSSFGGNPYVIKDGYNGLVFKSRDWNDLQVKIIEVYENKDLHKKLIENSIAEYKAKFTSTVMAKNITNLYLTLKGV